MGPLGWEQGARRGASSPREWVTGPSRQVPYAQEAPGLQTFSCEYAVLSALGGSEVSISTRQEGVGNAQPWPTQLRRPGLLPIKFYWYRVRCMCLHNVPDDFCETVAHVSCSKVSGLENLKYPLSGPSHREISSQRTSVSPLHPPVPKKVAPGWISWLSV